MWLLIAIRAVLQMMVKEENGNQVKQLINVLIILAAVLGVVEL